MLVLANGLLAGAEIALVSVRKGRLEALAKEGSRRAIAAQRLRAQPERFLATIQVGITVIGATAGAFGGARFASELAVVIRAVGNIDRYAEEIAFALVVGVISYLSVVVGELVPKSLALRSAERYALNVSQPLLTLAWVARPIVWLLAASSNALLRPFGDRTTFSEGRVTREELAQMVDDATRGGDVDPKAGDIASRALDLPNLTARDVMVPRDRIIAVRHDAGAQELRALLQEHAHSRLPVYRDHLDEIVGYVNVMDVAVAALGGRGFALDDILRPAHFVPETKRAVDLIHDMRQTRAPFSIVLDERGGTAGIVTMEDLLEELVGDIFSEFDTPESGSIREDPDGSILVNGLTPVRDVNRRFRLRLPEDGDWTSVAGLCLSIASTIPATGAILSLTDGTKLEIVDATPRRIRTVRIRPPSDHPLSNGA